MIHSFLKRVCRHILLVFVLSLSGFALRAQLRVVGYLPNSLDYEVQYDQITHLNLAFENPDSLGRLSFSPNNTAYIEGAHRKGKKVLVSIGGGGASFDTDMQRRYTTLFDDKNRGQFVSHVITYLSEHNFDGIDVDLEGPAINEHYDKFIADLHRELKPRGKMLTAALTHMNGADKISDQSILLFDFINVMAYDATGPWRKDRPGPHASYDFAVESLAYWSSRGLPKNKTVLGVPFYGYGFGNDFNEGMSFSKIINVYADAEKRDVSGDSVYYNGIPTIRKKAELVRTEKLGGIMIWQLAQDTLGAKSLLNTIHQALNRKK